MRRLILFIHLLLGILLGGCNSQPIPSSDMSPSIGEIISRDAIASTSIANGSQALFHATGGASIDNQIFMYNNGVWQNEEGESIPINTASETTLTALYPAYSGETLITDNPYDNDTLQDVLIAQSTFINQTDVQLKFRHLFSRLTVHVHSSIANEIEAVTIEVPKVVSIDPSNGTFNTSGTHATRPIETNTGIYSCIVPSLPDCPVKLTFTFDSGKEVVSSIPKHTFVSGHKYECHVNRPGIRNAEDLIAFSQFINDPNNKGKMHPEFGEKFGDSIVYRLLADIKLEPEDCEKLAPIGDHQDTPFYDTFDGEGHSISDLQFKAYNASGGLFSKVESSGVIKNLHIDNASGPIIKGKYGSGIGFIAGLCHGTIDNCHVTKSSLSNEEITYVGGIAGLLTGKVINCSVKDTPFQSTAGACGAIAGQMNSSQIINCYSYKNKFLGKSNYRGGITGYSDNGVISNCYVYGNTYNTTKENRGIIIGFAKNASVSYCYHRPSTVMDLIYNMPKNCVLSSIYEYNTSFNTTINGVTAHIYEFLNQWVGEQSIYRHWTTSDDGSPCFE